MGWLYFFGSRRPKDLGDQGMYKETERAKQPSAKKHKNPKGVEGTRLSKPNRQSKGK